MAYGRPAWRQASVNGSAKAGAKPTAAQSEIRRILSKRIDRTTISIAIEIQPRHFRALADEYPDAKAWPAMIDLAHRVEGAIKAVAQRLPNGFAQAVWLPISEGMLKQAKSFLSHPTTSNTANASMFLSEQWTPEGGAATSPRADYDSPDSWRHDDGGELAGLGI